MSGYLPLLIGVSIWFPMFSVLNIGNGTSVQLVVFFSIIYFITVAPRIRLSLRYIVWIVILIGFLSFQFFYSQILSEYDQFYVNGFLFFTLSIFIYFVGYVIASRKNDLINFFKGFYLTGLFVSLFSLLQFFVWSYLETDLSVFHFMRNSISFSDVLSDGRDFLDIGRSVGFFPEASILFIHLFALFVYTISARKSNIAGGLIFVAMLFTKSMGVLFILLPYLIYLIINRFEVNVFRLLMRWTLWSGALFLVLFYFIYGDELNNKDLIIFDNQNISYSADLSTRMASLTSSSSFLSRANSMINSYNLVLESPLLGHGVQSSYVKKYLIENSLPFETNIGINSMLLSMLVWFGIPALLLLIPFFYVLREKEKKPYHYFSIAVIVSSFLSLSYFNVYIFWIALGFSFYYFSQPNVRKI